MLTCELASNLRTVSQPLRMSSAAPQKFNHSPLLVDHGNEIVARRKVCSSLTRPAINTKAALKRRLIEVYPHVGVEPIYDVLQFGDRFVGS